MRYKLLLTGGNNPTIDDFFTHMDESFEMLTTSGRYIDISNHIKYFKPDIFVFCLNQSTQEEYRQFIMLKGKLEKRQIPLVIIGTEDECNNFSRYAVNVADLVLIRPITANMIMNKILDYMKEQIRLREEAEREEKERIEKERIEKERMEKERIKKERIKNERIKKERMEKERMEQKKAVNKKHILIVDDDPLMLKLLREYLHKEYDVATANSGKTAMKFLSKKKTDLILLDYEMPVEDGPAVLKKLHADDATKNIPVVFLTGITEYDKIKKALVQKPQGYLLKPVDHDTLFDTISKFIG